MTNKVKLKIFSGFIAAIFLTSSCELDLEPIDSIGDNAAFQTVEDLEKGMAGVMASYGGSGLVGVGDWASDDLRYAKSNTGQGVQVHNWTYTASTGDMAGTWNGNAALVDRANRILAVSEKFDADEESVKRIKSECLFTRAYAHFEIARTYCKPYDAADPLGIPYKKESAITGPARLSQSEVYQNILADIESSLSDLQYDDTYWVNKPAAYALKSRVALYMGDWDMAIEAADMAISEGGYRLAEIDEFAGIWQDEIPDNVEVIFRLRRESGGVGSYYTRTSNGDIFFHPSHDLMNQYADDDIRGMIYFGKDGSGKDIVAKHAGRNGQTNVSDLKVFRVSELILIKAEAYAQKEAYTDVVRELSLLREKRIYSPEALDITTKSEALIAVQQERRRELPYEGHRFYDLKRWGLGINRLSEDSEASASTLPASDYHFVFPIPQEEIFANKNMKQNDGYTN